MKKRTVIYNKKYLHLIVILLIMLPIMFQTGCIHSDNQKEVTEKERVKVEKVTRYNGEMSHVVSMVYTTKRALSLTFNGMGDAKTMDLLLDELDKNKVKATFFLPGMRVAEEPDIAKKIVARGHEIENNTLNQFDINELTYEQIYKEINLSNNVIKKNTGVSPEFVRTKSGEYNDDFRLATAHNKMKSVISNSLFLHNWKNETLKEKKHFIRKYINRGGIITLDINENKSLIENVQLISQSAKDVGYELVTLKELLKNEVERKTLEEIAGSDAAKVNLNYKTTKYNMKFSQANKEKQVVLTFDDWGTDYTITKILDILQDFNIKASFFLRADGVEKNPNLAKAISEAGHDVGNHSYSHPILSEVTPKEIQQDVVKAHQIITEAIQKKPTMIYRPPTGAITDKEARIISATGYQTIAIFDADPNDWNRKNNAEAIYKEVMKQTKNGSFILLHTLDDTHTIEALPLIIKGLKNEGYSFVKMTDLIGG